MANTVAKRVGIAAVGAAAVAAYAAPIRRWMRNWGASAEEIARVMPGDEVLPEALEQTTHAISVRARPEDVWPWLAQMGDRRGGFYGFDLLTRPLRLQHGKSAERIAPEHQVLREGDALAAGWTPHFVVLRAEPNRALVLRHDGRGYAYTWATVLEPEDPQRTRIVTRARYRGSSVLLALADPLVFVLTRRWLSELKKRAER